jgi:hypothetical protein
MVEWTETDSEFKYILLDSELFDNETLTPSDIATGVNLVCGRLLDGPISDYDYIQSVSFLKSEFSTQNEAESWVSVNWKLIFGDPSEGRTGLCSNWKQLSESEFQG